jgi:hypothetical protein
MKQLALDLIELVDVFEMGFSELTHYLDTETGKVVMVSEETRFDLDALFREAHEPGSDEEPDLVAIIEAQDIPDWQKEAMLDAYGVEVGTGRRYIEIPQDDTREAYRDMERFISTVQDERLQSLLWRAIDGRGAFRMFKDILREYPQERERWFDFKDDLVRQRVLGWLAAEGIEPLEP